MKNISAMVDKEYMNLKNIWYRTSL